MRANEVRLQLSVPAYTLGNLWRRLGLPRRMLVTDEPPARLMKTGGELRHALDAAVVPSFRANEVRLQLSVPAYTLGNLWRRLGLPRRIKSWSLTSLQHRLMKTGGELRHRF